MISISSDAILKGKKIKTLCDERKLGKSVARKPILKEDNRAKRRK